MLWGAPIALDILVSIIQGEGWISLWLAGVLWTATTFWIGVSCLINARRCSRVHCIIAGVLLLPSGAAGLANVTGLVSFSWSIVGIYRDSFSGIVAIAFVTEFLWTVLAVLIGKHRFDRGTFVRLPLPALSRRVQ